VNILIVDDDFVDREHIKRIIRKSDPSSSFTETDCVDEAESILREELFDVVLLDYRMPQRDGIELLLELRSEKQISNTAIVMLSNSEDEELASSCLRAGAQDFVPKNELSAARLRRAILQSQIRHELEKRLYQSYRNAKKLAEQDRLTGLANRSMFEESLKLSIANNRRRKCKVAMMLFDIDHFKFINDTHGHDVGDRLLKAVVDRVSTCLRHEELFARLGGDEFAIVLGNLESEQDIGAVAQRILASLEQPLYVSGLEIKVSISIGIAVHPDNATKPEELLKFADIAMYRAKKLGRNRVTYFEPAMQQQFLQRYRIEHQLKSAVSRKQLVLHYQPIIESKGRRLDGFEALLRWQVDGELRMPDTFIDVAEESGQMLEIGRWVIKEALRQLQLWQRSCGAPLNMSINLSATQLEDVQLTEYVSQCLRKHQIAPHNLQFEVTETAFIENADAHARFLDSLSDLGCRVALDDFGTGFSSVSHLHRFPIDTVKIDKSLMLAQMDGKALALVRGLAVMVQSLGLDIVAEGIETEESLALCTELEIDKMQGFYFSKPLPEAEIPKKYPTLQGQQLLRPAQAR
jgi:diguanylate cyclase (GGDEF)-like protein